MGRMLPLNKFAAVITNWCLYVQKYGTSVYESNKYSISSGFNMGWFLKLGDQDALGHEIP